MPPALARKVPPSLWREESQQIFSNTCSQYRDQVVRSPSGGAPVSVQVRRTVRRHGSAICLEHLDHAKDRPRLRPKDSVLARLDQFHPLGLAAQHHARHAAPLLGPVKVM